MEFVQDDEKLREERKKAKKNKDKYVGINSSGAGSGFGSMTSSKSSYSDFSSSRNTNTDDLGDKEWRSNKSSSIQERITNMTNQVKKNIIGNEPDEENNVSEEENDQNETYSDLGFENKPKKESITNKVKKTLYF